MHHRNVNTGTMLGMSMHSIEAVAYRCVHDARPPRDRPGHGAGRINIPLGPQSSRAVKMAAFRVALLSGKSQRISLDILQGKAGLSDLEPLVDKFEQLGAKVYTGEFAAAYHRV
ncbi:hypothetical protein [Pseudophaeobacter sp.]|uniref:hypothetical protein n=1 Tax=Pseudophaeobacter sp. TaxID=1971739 RepID=UPI0026338099|nr:hypothetical protein [Pseudophaeobacter sp.]